MKRFYNLRGMTFILTCTILIASCNQIMACGNEYGFSMQGQKMYTRYFFLSERMKSFDKVELAAKLKKAKSDFKADPSDFKLASNIALYQMKLGHADSALQILEPLAEAYPKEYGVQANLGTAYELTDQLDSALKYISRGVDINPKSHRGSEWIHVAILKAKIKRKSNRSYILKHPIIRKEKLISKADHRTHQPLRRIHEQLFYQIRTRVPFTPAPNEVIANLLVSIGELNEAKGTYENAILAYTYALQFNKNQWLKGDILYKIRKINRRRNMQHIADISPQFTRFIKKGQLDLNYLIIGIEEVGEHMDSIHLAISTRQDSIQSLQMQLDSVLSMHKQTEQMRKDSVQVKKEFEQAHPSKQPMGGWIYLLMGVGVGVAAAGVVFWLKSRFKK